MKDFLMKLWAEEDGAETAEWLAIVALILIVAIAVYQGALQQSLTDLANAIGTLLGQIVAPGP